jgi:hypothetical protein
MDDIWKPTKLDLILSAGIAISLPILAHYLFQFTGALIPLLIYYSLAWILPIWRRKGTGYNTKGFRKHQIAFYINTALIIICLVFLYLGKIIPDEISITGAILTALIWAPINASSEQLLWIYIFESWELYPIALASKITKGLDSEIINESTSESTDNADSNSSNKAKIWIFRIIGVIFFSCFVGLIHIMFWANFLHLVDQSSIFGILFIILSTITGFMHIIVWKKSKNMLFTFIPHLLLNAIPIIWTTYSIIPYLINF